jgi:predicted metal-binding membrane protein
MAAVAVTPPHFDRRTLAVLAAIAALTAIGWVDLARMAAEPAAMAAPPAWSAGYAAAMLAMWAVMMAAMMVPSAAPTIFLFAALRRHGGGPAARDTALFVAGYVLAWTAFSVAATTAQWALASTSLLDQAMAAEGPRLAGALFVVAGLYQFSSFKDACLGHCRSPEQFLVEHRRGGAWGSLAMGLEHGAWCVGCCAPLMALLFAFGVMNLLWVVALSAFVIAEKLLPRGRMFGRISGGALAGAGIAFLLL